MPPKKILTEATSNNCVAFGRVRSNLKMGCVGLPNVGKSSLFNLMTEQSAAAENYPFCTIEPNEARCVVPDERYVSSHEGTTRTAIPKSRTRDGSRERGEMRDSY